MSVKSCDVNFELENDPPDPAASHIEQGLQQGLIFCADKNWTDAAACFEAVVAQDPTHKIAWNNLGNVRDELGDTQGAYQAFQAALALDPDYASPKKNLAIVAYKEGGAQYAAGKLQEALDAFGVAASQEQNSADYDHSYLQLLLETCEHTHVQTHTFAMQVRSAQEGSYQPHPYPLLAAVDIAAWHLLVAKRHVTRLCNEAGVRVTRAVAAWPEPHERMRIAYLSCDWHVHPVPQQLLASIEAHDRTKFEIFGIATDGAADTSPWRQRIERAFDGFYALGQLSDSEIADELRRLNVDIAIDLSLYMQNGRPLILASRPCPVQVAYLGYAGTSGAPWIDYLIADEVVIPPTHESFYSEKIIRLPGSFMPDNNQRLPVRAPDNRSVSRTLQGLPEDAFVFCAFSNPYKITPELLRAWFRLLNAVPASVLWLQANNDVTKAHIEAATLEAGLTADRVVFANRLDSFDTHLQRYLLADLFLDTCPYNAHVTAADALWAGLPVLTLQGQSFASRVASSILTALDLPELITTDLASYEARALELANDALQLKMLRARLAKSKAEGRYFNQVQYVRGFERALTATLG
jgi:protein O-GlcNAc transferase